MLYLTEFDKKKLEGQLLLSRGFQNKAIQSFNSALDIKNDPEIYFHLAYAYCDLKDYVKAQECSLKAIELGYDAYALFSLITIGNLRDITTATNVLKKGMEKKHSSAYFEMAKLHIDNVVEPDMLDPYKASEYLELAYEYAPEEKKGQTAYSISMMYKMLYGFFPYFSKYTKENKELCYLKIFNKYGGGTALLYGMHTKLFDVANNSDDYSVVQTLFDGLNGEAMFIFALMLLHEEYSTTGTIVIKDNLGILVADEGATKFKHGGCYALLALQYGSDLEGSECNDKRTILCLKQSKLNQFLIPKSFDTFFDELMNHIYCGLTDGDTSFSA